MERKNGNESESMIKIKNQIKKEFCGKMVSYEAQMNATFAKMRFYSK
jgi:small nuclear ribonucleoprotein (snRNP)-like protein